jgi:hypothetical protein
MLSVHLIIKQLLNAIKTIANTWPIYIYIYIYIYISVNNCFILYQEKLREYLLIYWRFKINDYNINSPSPLFDLKRHKLCLHLSTVQIYLCNSFYNLPPSKFKQFTYEFLQKNHNSRMVISSSSSPKKSKTTSRTWLIFKNTLL